FVVLSCGIVRLYCEHFVVSLDRFFIGVILCLSIAEGKATGRGFNIPETFGGGEKIISAVSGNAPPHRVGEKLLRSSVVAAVECDTRLLVGSEPEIPKRRHVGRGRWGRELEHYKCDDPSYRHATPEPQQPEQGDRQHEPVAFVTPPRTKGGRLR